VLVAALLFVPAASAELSGNIFELQVCQNGTCVATYFVPSEGTWNPQTQQYEWMLDQDVVFQNTATGEVFGELQHGTAVVVQPSVGTRSDPQVHLNFVTVGGTTDTEFTVTSSLLNFAAMANPVGQSDVGINLTDRDGDGATLWAASGNNGVSFSHYNGLAPAGDVFSELLTSSVVVSNAYGSASGDDDTGGYLPINDTVSSMSAQIHFMVTAHDLASGSSTFLIVPEPASLVLLFALTLLRRR
jgi:hypothetical protein